MPLPKRKKRIIPLLPVSGFVLESRSDNVAILRAASGVLEARALSPDLFRVRIAPGSRFPGDFSWAVEKRDWAVCPVKIRENKEAIVLKTAAGNLSIHLESGRIELRDKFDFLVFQTAPEMTGFRGPKPQLALQLQERDMFFGLGETSGTYNKRGLNRELWNIDVLGHTKAIHPSLRSLYVSIPFAVCLRDGRAGGIFWDNTARQTWDIGQSDLDKCIITTDVGHLDLYFFLGPTVPQLVERFTELTGRIRLPPKWALGYQQCRYSYETRQRVEEIARNFRQREIPCDVIYLDIHHMRGYRVFTFGPGFPRAEEMTAQLARSGFKVVTIVDPGVKEDPKFGVLQRGLKIKGFVRNPDGRSDYMGRVWPGDCRFPDYLNPKVREWWANEQLAFQKRFGLAGFWNDMNEPANFAAPNKSLDERCVHKTEFGLVRHTVGHNVYGMTMARASQEGALLYDSRQRPFIISRAGYAGIQRYALVWTGDNTSCWEHLSDTIQMLINLSVSGVSFCGGDVGGFLDNTTGELLARWTQLAAFTPFYRNHSNIETHDQEPWSYGPAIEAICKRFINLRYQLLPYIYCLFAEARARGTAIMRPLFWHYQNDPTAASTGDQFMLGPFVLVAPILRQAGQTRSVYLPVGRWIDFWSGLEFGGGQHILAHVDLSYIPVYIRAGSIIPMCPVQQYIGEKKVDVITLHIWPGRDAELSWYEDDGLTNDYIENNHHQRRIEYVEMTKGGILRFSPAEGSFQSEIQSWRVIVHNARRAARVKLNGTKLPSQFEREYGLHVFEFENAPEAMELQWS
jgi:alpha-glucosidase